MEDISSNVSCLYCIGSDMNPQRFEPNDEVRKGDPVMDPKENIKVLWQTLRRLTVPVAKIFGGMLSISESLNVFVIISVSS